MAQTPNLQTFSDDEIAQIASAYYVLIDFTKAAIESNLPAKTDHEREFVAAQRKRLATYESMYRRLPCISRRRA